MNIIKNGYQCTGCTACYAVCIGHAITMISDNQGFLQPQVDETKCIECNRCQITCPVNSPPAVSKKTEIYAAYNNNIEVRINSSSGGIFFLLAEKILEENGVVYGAVYGPLKKVIHISVTEKDELRKIMGAKYVQSDLGSTFIQTKEHLREGKKVLFSGTPCQIAGLKKYLGKEYDNLVTLDIVCHGVPSPLVWESYVNYRREKDKQDESASIINMRDKESGWSRYSYSVTFRYDTGRKYIKRNNKDFFMQGFVNDYFLRSSCYDCRFKGIERCSDFTIGDFWGVWDFYPEIDDNKGTSVVFIHSRKAKVLWEKVNTNCTFLLIVAKEAVAQNPSIESSAKRCSNRNNLLEKIKNDNFNCIINEINKKEDISIKNKIKNQPVFLRCLKIIKNKIVEQ